MKFSRKFVIASLLVVALLSTPLWLPSIQAAAASKPSGQANPFTDSSVFYIFDAGRINGSLTQRVVAVPQVLAWSADPAAATWSVETGLIYGGFRDAQAGRIYLTELRSATSESLLNAQFPAGDMSVPNAEWPLSLTVLNERTGEVLSRSALDGMPVKTPDSYSLQPVGVAGEILYMMNYSQVDNLFAYNLTTGQFEEESWSICEHGYVMMAKFLPTPARVAALCGNSISVTNVESGEQASLDVPVLGEEEWETGNGLVLGPNGSLYLIDSDAGVLSEIDLERMEIARSVHYAEGLAEQSSNFFDEAVTWIADQFLGSASAKRWTALTALSPDGRWLVVDGGFGASEGAPRNLVLIDMQTLQATQSIALKQTPSQIAFGEDGNLLVIFEKQRSTTPADALLIQLASGEQMELKVATNGWIQNLIAGD